MRFLGVDSDQDRRRIQALRADPPGHARRGKRKEVFGAALEQWDELLAASAAVAPDAAPILLFYALSQGGRAACAARIAGQPWASTGHGLTVGQPTGGIENTTVRPEGGANTSFAMFCRAAGSESLTAPTTLGTLWAANPKLEPAPDLGQGSPRALELSPITSGGPTSRALIIGPVAEGLPADESAAAAELAKRLAPYPGAADGLIVSNAFPRTGANGRHQVEIGWRDTNGQPIDVAAVASGYGPPNSGTILRPALNSSRDVLRLLPLWWATLLVLSSIARYHPAEWSAALARDRSRAAIPIEDGLDIAREMLPWLLLGLLQSP
ncbi:MAG TPA: hypothetical protein VMD09_10575 [Solirubrobacteraceae bacterium]|nr:hypothetical protein [Solirubrobacteraceae bacterium]